MKFPLEVLNEAKNREKLLEILKNDVCDNCLGRQFGMLGHGLTNIERGKTLRHFASKLTKSKLKEPDTCKLCNNFFRDRINKLAISIVKKINEIEFDTFLVGTILSNEIAKRQDELWEKVGVEDVESIKSEINRELGKKIEKLTKKKFDLRNPEVIILVDLIKDIIKLQVRSLYIFGKYQKLVRGIPQTKWICPKCRGKGCTYCKGEGKLYKTSVQEEIERQFLKETKSKKSYFHGSGREDIDARNLDWRPFVIEMARPLKRKINLKKIEKIINKSKKVKVRVLKFVQKDLIKKIKFAQIDKTYLAVVDFTKAIDKKKLKLLKSIIKEPIMQQTPSRVVHRRANKMRKRLVKSISWKILGKKKLELKIKAQSGLYIKELISGDESRTRPNISEILENKVKKIILDVVKIHTKKII